MNDLRRSPKREYYLTVAEVLTSAPPEHAATLQPAQPEQAPAPGSAAAADPEPSRARPAELPFAATMAGPKSPVSVAQEAVFPVKNWDRYEFLALLGQGGMGSVYRARDKRLGRVVALKFIRGEDASLAMRFLQESRAQARIEHPGVCKVYEVGEVDGKVFIAMQLVEGKTLDKLCPALSLNEKVLIIRDVAEAIHTAHKLGIIHRDRIPPSRIAAYFSAPSRSGGKARHALSSVGWSGRA